MLSKKKKDSFRFKFAEIFTIYVKSPVIINRTRMPLNKIHKGNEAPPSKLSILRKPEWLVMKYINWHFLFLEKLTKFGLVVFFLFRKKMSCGMKLFGFFEGAMCHFNMPLST